MVKIKVSRNAGIMHYVLIIYLSCCFACQFPLVNIRPDRRGEKNKKWKEILQIEIKCPEVQNAGQHYKENPVKPPEVVTKCTDSHALSYQINHSNRRLARLGETLCRRGRRYGSEKRKTC